MQEVIQVNVFEKNENPNKEFELESLINTAGGKSVAKISQVISKVNPAYYIGSGKVSEIEDIAKKLDVKTVVFDVELSASQLRNLEEKMKLHVVDWTTLILDIFAQRANTKEAKLKIKLAQLKYQLPRINKWFAYLSRQSGGIGTRGPGETMLETDKRAIVRDIRSLEEKLKDLEKTKSVNRKSRDKILNISLLGYTNAGKSTILNRLKDEDSGEVSVKNMLFETLDPSSRKARLLSGREFIISDTVGFVSKLPTKIVEAFKSTLEEIKYSDLILHVIDASSEDLEIQYKTTMSILKDIDVLDKNIITVFNKVDKVNTEDINLPLKVLPEKKIYISAKNDENMDELLKIIEDNLKEKYFDVKLKFAYGDTDLLYKLVEKFDAKPLYEDDGIYLELKLEESEYEKVKDYVVNV